MGTITLGSTGITANKNGFGALPIQRIPLEEAVQLLHRAYEGGIRFFDTARGYSDSEEKLGAAFGGSGLRETLYLATKTHATSAKEFWEHLETSLRLLKTDYVDLYQFHNPPFCPKPGDGSGLYEAMLEAKAQGKVRHIGITEHRTEIAQEAIESGLYETLQFPLNYLSNDRDLKLVELCKQHNMGFLAMKSLSGGLITNSAAAYAYLDQFDNVLPIWGIQKESELAEFLSYVENPPILDEKLQAVIDQDRKELTGNFCRGCGYCLPCPAGIDIPNAARMSLLLRRSPTAQYLTAEGQEKMRRIEDCIHCHHCVDHCPYGLDTPELLRRNYAVFLCRRTGCSQTCIEFPVFPGYTGNRTGCLAAQGYEVSG